MDGTNRTRIVEHKVELPSAVALDLVKKLVYWADAYLDYIEVVDYYGRNRQSVIRGSSVSMHLCFLPCDTMRALLLLYLPVCQSIYFTRVRYAPV